MSYLETSALLDRFAHEDYEEAIFIDKLFDGEKANAIHQGQDWQREFVRLTALDNAINAADEFRPQPAGFEAAASLQPHLGVQTWRDAQRWRQLRGAYLQDKASIAERVAATEHPQDTQRAVAAAAIELHDLQALHGSQEAIEYELLAGNMACIELCAQAERRRRLTPAPEPDAPGQLLDHERQTALTGLWNAAREITDDRKSNYALQLPIFNGSELNRGNNETLTADVTYRPYQNPPRAILDLHRTSDADGPMQLAELTLQDQPKSIAEHTQQWVTPTQTVERPLSTPTILSIAQQILPPEEILTFEHINPLEARS